jgi:GAF domain-containing protein
MLWEGVSVKLSESWTELAQLATRLSARPDIESAQEVIVESARRLTGADSTCILLLDKREKELRETCRAPRGSPSGLVPHAWSLLKEVVESGQPLHHEDIEDVEAGQPEQKEARLLIGVPLEWAEERFGVLCALTRQRRFTEEDVDSLGIVAGLASIALGWQCRLQEPWIEIERCIASLFDLDKALASLCHELDQTLGFDFSAVQLVRRDRNIVENWFATSAEIGFEGRSRHYLHEEKDLRDIQADIVLASQTWPHRTEVLRGWDFRFDRGIYEAFGHQELVRIFSPLVIVRTPAGELVEDWVASCQPQFTSERQGDSERIVIELEPPADRELAIEVIGTVEAGFRRRDRSVSEEQVLEVIAITARHATELHHARLRHVLETVVEQIRRFAQADAATLHCLHDAGEHRFLHEVGSPGVAERLLAAHRSHCEELGESALGDGKPHFLPDPAQGHAEDELKRLRPDLAKESVRSMAVFPLLAGPMEGVVYLYYRQPHQFRDEEVGWIEFLGKRAADAVRQAMRYVDLRDQTHLLRTLQSVIRELVKEVADPDLPVKIARTTLNTLAADVVTIYQHDALEQSFQTPPAMAGRVRHEVEMQSEIGKDDAPALLIGHDDIFVDHDVEKNEILSRPGRSGRTKLPFAVRESIRACAGVRLKIGDEIVGAMFINYRRPHPFSIEEIEIIRALASAAAIAIRNQRLFEKRQNDLMVLAHDLHSPLVAVAGHLYNLREQLRTAQDLDREELARGLDDALDLNKNVTDLSTGLYVSLVRDGSQVSINPKIIYIPAEVSRICERVRRTNRRPNLDFDYVIQPEFPSLSLDLPILSSVVYRIVQNAMKYALPNTVVKISCRHDRGRAWVEVRTRGPRIEEDEVERIFRKSVRGRAAERSLPRGGTGLGLWAARVSMRTLGGDLRLVLSADEPQEATFVLDLPMPAEIAELDLQEATERSRKTILWVDDQPSIIAPFANLLKTHGYAVDEERYLSAAERRLLAERYDLLILDLMVPLQETEYEDYRRAENDGYSGLELYKRLRKKLDESQRPHVLVFTSVVDQRAFDKCRVEGLPKDCFVRRLDFQDDPKRLLPIIETLVGRASA